MVSELLRKLHAMVSVFITSRYSLYFILTILSRLLVLVLVLYHRPCLIIISFL
jgi:hypothetical protein